MAKELNYKTLLDCWSPPNLQSADGEPLLMIPVAFVATSFTFDSEFFEEECLTRFLAMECEKENDGVAYLVEREEKLAGLSGGMVLVDQHHCKGVRSLRWDLVPCRVKNGILHSKIVVLQWSNCIRLIIGSANLTQPGYCINQEIFGVFDYHAESDANPDLLIQILKYLKDLTNEQCGSLMKEKYKALADGAKAFLKHSSVDYKRNTGVAVDLLLISPKQPDGFSRLRALWDDRFSSPPETAWITSPFFDEHEHEQSPSKQIFDILRQRGDSRVKYQLTTQSTDKINSSIIVNGPAYLQKSPRPSASVQLYTLDETGGNERNHPVPRPLHRKTIWLENSEHNLLLAGSSNFTSAAFGVGRNTNYEANIIYTVNRAKSPKAYKDLCYSHIEGDAVDLEHIRFLPKPNEDEALEDSAYLLLPDIFGEAVFSSGDKGLCLQLHFCKGNNEIVKGFKISYEIDTVQKILFGYEEWQRLEFSELITMPWSETSMPDHLIVQFDTLGINAFWPVIIETQIALPPVESLRNLSLNSLLFILSSSQPLHRLLALIEKSQAKNPKSTEEPMAIDPHKLVNTSMFLLQRTRRVSNAYRCLVARLEKPVFSKHALNWRLYGPIGIESLVNALKRDTQSAEEMNFLLAELALDLSRLKPQCTPRSLKPEQVRAAVKDVIVKLLPPTNANGKEKSPIQLYSLNAYNLAVNEF